MPKIANRPFGIFTEPLIINSGHKTRELDRQSPFDGIRCASQLGVGYLGSKPRTREPKLILGVESKQFSRHV
jgi:hypothetical protein